MMIVMRGQVAGAIAMFMSTRTIRYHGGKADRAAANEGEHTQDQKKSPEQTHSPNLSRRAKFNNVLD